MEQVVSRLNIIFLLEVGQYCFDISARLSENSANRCVFSSTLQTLIYASINLFTVHSSDSASRVLLPTSSCRNRLVFLCTDGIVSRSL